jgi:hypothetical protein
MKNNLTEQEFVSKLVEHFYKLVRQADLDKMVYGNAYWEFGERSLEIIDPKKINKRCSKKGKEVFRIPNICNDNLKGKGLIKPKKNDKK